MATKLTKLSTLILFSIIFLISLLEARTQSKPTTLFLPLQKDNTTGLLLAYITKRNPQSPIPYLVVLNAKFLWENCMNRFLSSPKNFPPCHSTQCARANIHKCRQCSSQQSNCHNNACGIVATNPLTSRNAVAELALDVLSIQSAQGSNLGPMLKIPQFLFACAPSTLLKGPLPKNVQGVVGLGHNPISLPSQLASQFGLSPQFALCLPSSPSSKGVIFFGNGPYIMQPGIDISAAATFTPLTVDPKGEYFIQVSTIRIGGKTVPFGSSSAPKQMISPKTMISTVLPYTTLEPSIYTQFTQFFASQLSFVPQIKPPVPPFGLCFDSTKLPSTRVGPGVPTIDLVLHNNTTLWTIFGANSMVQARPGVACLGFVKGEPDLWANIVIGAHQLEDNLVQFDFARSRLGVSSSLLFRRTNCGNFNFGSHP